MSIFKDEISGSALPTAESGTEISDLFDSFLAASSLLFLFCSVLDALLLMLCLDLFNLELLIFLLLLFVISNMDTSFSESESRRSKIHL